MFGVFRRPKEVVKGKEGSEGANATWNVFSGMFATLGQFRDAILHNEASEVVYTRLTHALAGLDYNQYLIVEDFLSQLREAHTSGKKREITSVLRHYKRLCAGVECSDIYAYVTQLVSSQDSAADAVALLRAESGLGKNVVSKTMDDPSRPNGFPINKDNSVTIETGVDGNISTITVSLRERDQSAVVVCDDKTCNLQLDKPLFIGRNLGAKEQPFGLKDVSPIQGKNADVPVSNSKVSRLGIRLELTYSDRCGFTLFVFDRGSRHEVKAECQDFEVRYNPRTFDGDTMGDSQFIPKEDLQ